MNRTTQRRGRMLAAAAALAVATLGSAVTDRALALDPGDLLVSEFRTSGANAGDEYVEVYNNTGANITLSDATLILADANNVTSFALPNVTLPGRRTYLVTRSGGSNYTLGSYATGNAFFSLALQNAVGVRLRDTVTNVTLDQASTTATTFGTAPDNTAPEGAPVANAGVGGTNAQQYAYVRKLRNSGTPRAGRPLDTGNNATDFDTVSTNTNAAGPAAGVGIYGQPNPQNLGDPRQRNNSIAVSLLDGETSPDAAPSRVYNASADPDGAGPGEGTLRIRRELTNNTNNPLTELRIRVVDITTLRSPGDLTGQARIRLLGSATPSAGCPAPCVGAVLQAGGGALNPTDDPATTADESLGGFGLYSSAAIQLPGAGIPVGDSTNVEFRLGVERAGAFRFFFNLEGS